MSEAVRRLVEAARQAWEILDNDCWDYTANKLMASIAAVELELDPPFTIHKVVKTVAADDREVGNGKGGRL
jgi:hypothetical protein